MRQRNNIIFSILVIGLLFIAACDFYGIEGNPCKTNDDCKPCVDNSRYMVGQCVSGKCKSGETISCPDNAYICQDNKGKAAKCISEREEDAASQTPAAAPASATPSGFLPDAPFLVKDYPKIFCTSPQETSCSVGDNNAEMSCKDYLHLVNTCGFCNKYGDCSSKYWEAIQKFSLNEKYTQSCEDQECKFTPKK